MGEREAGAGLFPALYVDLLPRLDPIRSLVARRPRDDDPPRA